MWYFIIAVAFLLLGVFACGTLAYLFLKATGIWDALFPRYNRAFDNPSEELDALYEQELHHGVAEEATQERLHF